MPGLIDIHTHAARSKEGRRWAADGVTGYIDAGSYGADHIGETTPVAKAGRKQGRLLINIGRDRRRCPEAN